MILGYGGNLIWSGVIKEIHLQDTVKPVVCLKPNLSDFLSGFLYDRYSSLIDDPIFKNNPRISFTQQKKNRKPIYWRLLDFIFKLIIHPRFIHLLFEKLVFKLAVEKYRKQGTRLVHVDMRIHSYALSESKRRMIWKKGGHAIQIIARRFGVECKIPDCELTFTKGEELDVDAIIFNNRLDRFIVVDPNTNQDWFGVLRSWPFERWQSLVDMVINDFPDIKIIQIGLVSGDLLNNVIDLRGRTSFRQAAILIKKASFFIGTEGGLMHAARAVKARSIIIWGGVTLPEFAGYPNYQKTICKYVKCAPCGNLGWCNNDHICMKTIEVEDVYKELNLLLNLNCEKKHDKTIVN